MFFLLPRKDAEWDESLKNCLSVVGVKGELAAYLERHVNQRGWKELMEYLRQPGADSLNDWHDLLVQLGTRDIDGLTVGKFVEVLGHENVRLSTASRELKAALKGMHLIIEVCEVLDVCEVSYIVRYHNELSDWPLLS